MNPLPRESPLRSLLGALHPDILVQMTLGMAVQYRPSILGVANVL